MCERVEHGAGGREEGGRGRRQRERGAADRAQAAAARRGGLWRAAYAPSQPPAPVPGYVAQECGARSGTGRGEVGRESGRARCRGRAAGGLRPRSCLARDRPDAAPMPRPAAPLGNARLAWREGEGDTHAGTHLQREKGEKTEATSVGGQKSRERALPRLVPPLPLPDPSNGPTPWAPASPTPPPCPPLPRRCARCHPLAPRPPGRCLRPRRRGRPTARRLRGRSGGATRRCGTRCLLQRSLPRQRTRQQRTLTPTDPPFYGTLWMRVQGVGGRLL